MYGTAIHNAIKTGDKKTMNAVLKQAKKVPGVPDVLQDLFVERPHRRALTLRLPDHFTDDGLKCLRWERQSFQFGEASNASF
jgi:hypothetical protein